MKTGSKQVWLLFFLFLQVTAYGQQSLQEVYDLYRPQLSQAKGDTTHVKLLWKYGYALMQAGSDSALPVLEQAEQLAIKINMPAGVAGSARMKGQAYLQRRDPDAAKAQFERAIQLYSALPKQTENLATAYGLLGQTLDNDGATDEGIAKFLKAAEIAEANGHTRLLAQLYTSVSAAFGKLRHTEKTLEYAGKVEQIAMQVKDTLMLINSLNNKAAIYGIQGKHAEALAIYRKIMLLSDLKNYYTGRVVSRLNTGDHYEVTGQLDSAVHYLGAAELLARQANDEYHLSRIDLVFARTYLKMKEYVKAKTRVERSIATALPAKNYETLRFCYACLTRVYAGLGKSDSSMAAFSQYQEYNDSLTSERVSGQVVAYETKFQTLQKDKEISKKQLALVQKDLELKQKNTYILVAVGIVIVLLLVGAMLWFNYRQKQRLQAQQLITLQREHEISSIQAMMDGEERERVRIASNLHDGAGSLLSAVKLYLSALGNQHQQLSASTTYQETLGLVNDAASEIRETSHNLMPRVIRQQGLREAVRTYCDKLNKNDQIAVEFNAYGVPRRLDEAMELMVYRTIQELIGNVLKHAEATHVLVQLSFDKDLFSVTVEDNGKGFDKRNREHKAGIGIYGIQSRVEAFHGTMDIDSSPTGTSVYLEFKTTALIQEV
ncbi:hypothetical protein D3H65_06025 [Paraflavitalea soli]|uniref:histidine kinase n=1 Tax=Paraflavitalea soli TaxID=2315862 RepID=A0A3B7MJT4_9BACT|nr:ATP-binding protein [Paraflavitalea soli]AXY73563.1 hypothetical protein D3H65_06025 [Paraflavitalea soli]